MSGRGIDSELHVCGRGIRREIDVSRRDERESCFKGAREAGVKNDRPELTELQQ